LPRSDPSQRRPRWPALLDGALDGLLVSYAAWTIFYEVALLFQFSVLWAAVPFVLVTLASAWWGARREAERGRPSDRAVLTSPMPSGRTCGSRPWALVIGAALVVVTAALHSRIGLIPLAVVAIILLVQQLWPWLRHAAPAAGTYEAEPRGTRNWEHVLALAISAGLGVLALFLLKADADDAYYVNRATWIANHGVPVLKDTMFGPGTFSSMYGGGLPTPSVEALQGTLAALLGVQAPTLAYLIWGPVVAALFGWVTWRLVRSWASRHAALVYIVTILFVLASGRGVIGSYSVGRIWQGKVTAFAVLLPLIWLYLGQVARGRERGRTGLLFVAGVAFVGFTTTSALLAPVMFAAVLLAALVLRSRAMLIGGIAFVAAPLANGIVEKFGPAAVGPQDSVAAPADQVYLIAFGSVALLAVLGVLAIVVGPRLVSGRASVVAACASLAVMVIYLPGVLGVVDVATNAGPVIWRLAIEAPTAVFVGMLVVTPLTAVLPRLGHSAAQLAAPVVAVVMAVLIAVSAAWLWSAPAGGQLTSRPTWKVDQRALANVRAAQQLQVPKGLWLLPPAEMEILSIAGDNTYPVIPRVAYLTDLDPTSKAARERRVLLRLVSGQHESPRGVAAALAALRVGLACVPHHDARARHILAAATGSDLRKVGRMRCVVEELAR
jgi:hypothetical protein